MKAWARNPGILCKFVLKEPASSVEKYHQGTSTNQPGLERLLLAQAGAGNHPAQRLILLFLLTLRCDLWLIPFPSLCALVSSYHLIALSF